MKNEAQRFDVSSQLDMCRNCGTQVEEHQQDWSSGQVHHSSKEEVFTYVQEEEKNVYIINM